MVTFQVSFLFRAALLGCCLWWCSLTAYAQSHAPRGDFQLQFSTRKDTIKQLDLVYYALMTIPTWVYDCPNLEVLNISGNLITKLPRRLNRLKKLQSIVWNNQLNAILLDKIDTAQLRSFEDTHEAWKYVNAAKVALEKAKITPTPNVFSFGRLKRIKCLTMSENYLVVAPKQLRKVRNLDTLVLSKNALTQLPTKCFNKKLRHLALNYNQINLRADDDFSALKNLKSLYFIFNQIDNIPTGINALSNLETLNFSNNLLTVEKISNDFSGLQQLRILGFYKNELREIPTGVFGLPYLEELDLYYNQLDSISPRIATLTHLKSLAVAHNKLQSLPKELEQLKELTNIYAHHNQLQSLPIDFSNFSQLEVLHIEFNQLKVFPVGLSKVKTVKSIDLAYNKLLNIVGNITQLPHLEYLNLRDNPVTTNEKVRTELESFAKKLAVKGTKVIY